MAKHVLNVSPVDLGGQRVVRVWPFAVAAPDGGPVSEARLGAVAFQLGQTLHHDLCVGVDIGGRDRTSSYGNDRLLAAAVAGDSTPAIWVPETARAITTETLSEADVEAVLLGAARALHGRYQRNWLYLRDGAIPEAEFEALRAVAARARSEGLLLPAQHLIAVEIKKDHGLRIFKAGDKGWEQPDTGMHWTRAKHNEVLLTTTGAPWNTPGSAVPLRLVMRLVSGSPERRITRLVLQDLYWLTHLNYSAPRAAIRLPLPLHLAQKLGEDLAHGLPLRLLPF